MKYITAFNLFCHVNLLWTQVDLTPERNQLDIIDELIVLCLIYVIARPKHTNQ